MFFSVELLQKKQFRQKGPGFGNCQAFLGVPRQIFFFSFFQLSKHFQIGILFNLQCYFLICTDDCFD